MGQANSLIFVPPVPSLLCAGLLANQPVLGTHQVLVFLCLWAVVKATFVDHRGFTRELWWRWWPVHVGGVVLLVGFARVTNETGVLFQRCTTPCFWVSDLQDLSGTDCGAPDPVHRQSADPLFVQQRPQNRRDSTGAVLGEGVVPVLCNELRECRKLLEVPKLQLIDKVASDIDERRLWRLGCV